MNPPKLTKEQEELIKNSDFSTCYIWMQELYPAIKINSEISKLYNYLNEKMKEKV